MRSNFSAVQIDFSLHAHVSFYPTPCFVTLHLLLIFLLLILSFIDLTFLLSRSGGIGFRCVADVN